MNILYISSADNPDYQCDMLFHGLKSLESNYNIRTIDVNKLTYLYNTYENIESLYGRGFTLYGLLNDTLEDRDEIESKILRKKFDYIIYGSIRRCKNYIDLVLAEYPNNKIIFIDGEDDIFIQKDLIGRGWYFKRELIFNHTKILPINFGFPESKIINTSNLKKTKLFAYIDPRDKSTYIYKNEASYYNDYSTSFYGITMKKAGWDCLRHYEIIANYCMPLFIDIDDCPIDTMINFPKYEIKKVLNLFLEKNMTQDKELIFNENMDLIFNYFKKNCTTESIAHRLLNTIGALQ